MKPRVWGRVQSSRTSASDILEEEDKVKKTRVWRTEVLLLLWDLILSPVQVNLVGLNDVRDNLIALKIVFISILDTNVQDVEVSPEKEFPLRSFCD